MKKIFLLLLSFISFACIAQSVSINSDGSSPNLSAMLDVKSNSKGILIPRTSTIARQSIASPAKGLLIFDTTVNTFWFYNGSAWMEISPRNFAWNITGNTGTDTAVNFIGTLDAMPLLFKVNNQKSGIIDSARSNTSFGYRSLALRYGSRNTAVGSYALKNVTSGSDNIAMGANSLIQNTTGDLNSAMGSSSLESNTVGSGNTAAGYGSLKFNTTGGYNTAMGTGALFLNTVGYENCALGGYALYNNVGSGNIAIGANAMINNTTGSRNTVIGGYAMKYNTTGSDNIAIGYNSGVDPLTPYLYNTISIGNDNKLNASQNQALIGNGQMLWNGGNVTWSTYSDARVKSNIADDVKGLDFITRLRPITYHRDIKAFNKVRNIIDTFDYPGKNDLEKIKFSGFLAQEVEKAAIESGYDFSGYTTPKNEHDLYTLSYESFVVPLVKAVQEQQKIIEDKQRQFDSLKKQMENQQIQIESLEKRLTALDKK